MSIITTLARIENSDRWRIAADGQPVDIDASAKQTFSEIRKIADLAEKVNRAIAEGEGSPQDRLKAATTLHTRINTIFRAGIPRFSRLRLWMAGHRSDGSLVALQSRLSVDHIVGVPLKTWAESKGQKTAATMITNAIKHDSTELKLTTLWLPSLPREIAYLSRLTTLSVAYNLLGVLPPEIGDLNQLTQLHASSNRLASLPKELGNLTNLTSLWLINNRLTSLPEELRNLTNLTSLWLKDNKITLLPKGLQNLQELTILDVTNNPLARLPASITCFASKTVIRLTPSDALRAQLDEIAAHTGSKPRIIEIDPSRIPSL